MGHLPLRRQRCATWNDVFRRSTLGQDVFYVSDEVEYYVFGFCKHLEVPYGHKGSLYSSSYETWAFLDGGAITIHPYGFGGLRGTRVVGFGVLRYICQEFGVRPPVRRLKGELEVPQLDALRSQLQELRSSDQSDAGHMVEALFARTFGPPAPGDLSWHRTPGPITRSLGFCEQV